MENRLRGLSKNVKAMMETVINRAYEEGYEAGKASVVEDKPALSANQQRAALIQRAREFVKTHGESVKLHRQDNAVFAFKKSKSGWATGTACCMPGDTFNESIGQAIALARALKLEIPKEFLNAVRPTVAPGQVFKVNEDVPKKDVRGRVAEITTLLPTHNHLGFGTAFKHTLDSGWLGERQVTIIDDTNAEYGV